MDTPGDIPSDNIVSLPDSLHFWRCALCNANIHASLKENSQITDPPAIVTIKDPATQELKRIIFCPLCSRTRTKEIYQCVSQKIPQTHSETNRAITELKNKPWLIMESEKTNLLGERLRILAWCAKDFGIFSAVTLFGNGIDKMVCYNLSGLSPSEFDISVGHVKTHYNSEFGEIRERERGKRMSFTSVRFPLFRSHLIGSGEQFSVSKRDGAVLLNIGRAELELPFIRFNEVCEVLSATSAFLQLGSLSQLEALKEKNNNICIWNKNKPNIIVQLGSPGEENYISVQRRGTSFNLYLSWLRLDLEIFDFIDIIKIIEKLPAIFEETIPVRLKKGFDRLKSDRYIRITDLMPVTHKLIMSDLGWGFDSKAFLKLANAYQLFQST